MQYDIMVSICCITYNHEKFIRQALESFLIQKTNFKYEIIVRDDASTDNTVNIIKEYQEKYPDIVKPIYEKENGYQKGIQPALPTFQRAKGKYIAICEGDDYWIDSNKLQIQVDYMEKNHECSFCFHNAQKLNMITNDQTLFMPVDRKQKYYFKKEGNYSVGELALLGFIPTASFLIKSEFAKNLPKWYSKAIAGDIAIRLIITSKGYAHYINKVMSVYRTGNSESMSQVWKKEDKNKDVAIKSIDQYIDIYNYMDEYTNGKWKEEFEICKKYKEIDKLIIKKEFDKLKSKEYKKYYNIKYGTWKKIKIKVKKMVKIWKGKNNNNE